MDNITRQYGQPIPPRKKIDNTTNLELQETQFRNYNKKQDTKYSTLEKKYKKLKQENKQLRDHINKLNN